VPLRLWASVPLGLCASVPLGLWASSPQDHWASRPLCHWAQLLGLLDSGALRTLGPLGGLWNSRSLGVLWDLPLPLCSAAHLPLCLFPRASFLPPPASCRLYSWPAGFGLFLSSLSLSLFTVLLHTVLFMFVVLSLLGLWASVPLNFWVSELVGLWASGLWASGRLGLLGLWYSGALASWPSCLWGSVALGACGH